MTSAQMYELARDAVIEQEHISPDDPIQPDVLWVGGILEDRRAVVWLGEKLFMVRHSTITEKTLVETYTRQEA